MQKLEDAGIIDEISDNELNTPFRPKIKPTNWSEVEINDVIQIFFVLLFGAALALIFFCIEKLSKKMEENTRKSSRIKDKKRFAVKLQSHQAEPSLKHLDRFLLYKYAELI